MASVVFLRAVNVGTTNRCRPATIAQQLASFGIVNIGAVGTFVVRQDVDEAILRRAIAKKLPFKCEIMICAGRDVTKLVSKDPFAGEPSGPTITRFVNVLARPLPRKPSLPFHLPTDDNWGVRIIGTQGKFVLGLYRRDMKAISYLGGLEKRLGVPATNRSWNTIEKIAKALDHK